MQNSGRITSTGLGIFLAIVGVALALAQIALPTLGLEISRAWAWTLLVLAALLIVGALIALFWPWIKAGFYWIASRVTPFLRHIRVPLGIGLIVGAVAILTSGSYYNAVVVGVTAFVLVQLSFAWWQRRVEKIEAHKEAMSNRIDDLTDKLEETKQKRQEMEELRNGQIRARCGRLSRELFRFHEEEKHQELSNVMYHFNQRFGERVNVLRGELMQLGWWNPKEERREQLENPKNLSDILALADYLGSSCQHGFW